MDKSTAATLFKSTNSSFNRTPNCQQNLKQTNNNNRKIQIEPIEESIKIDNMVRALIARGKLSQIAEQLIKRKMKMNTNSIESFEILFLSI